MKRVLIVFGTRPEAIKCIPVIRALHASAGCTPIVCTTGQHQHMTQQVLEIANITPDYDLGIMKSGQNLYDITRSVLDKLVPVIAESKPNIILVQGDTSTAFTAALASYYARIPVGHIEAGLRSFDNYSPWPEEGNRRMISTLAQWHFAPTTASADNLRQEHIADTAIHITGNTVIDSLLFFKEKLESNASLASECKALLPAMADGKRRILVTSHRREHFQTGGISSICNALLALAKRGDVDIVFPVHPNPQVRGPVESLLLNVPNIHIIEPLSYLPFIYTMMQSHLILSDSGGIQEEAPALGKPLLVLRDTTERPEAIDAGTALLVGTNTAAIIQHTNQLLDDTTLYEKMSRAHNPFGDGNAAQRIVETLVK